MTDREPRRPADPRIESHAARRSSGSPAARAGIPSDPTGLREPHDVLAAEEFAMPAGAYPDAADGGGPGVRAFLPLALAALILLVVFRRRR